MADFWVILFLILIFCGLRIAPKNEFFDDYLTLNQTQNLKGIAAVAIMYHHIAIHATETNLLVYFGYIGYIVCGLFFFWAGYGVLVSSKLKENYFESFVRLRLSKVLLPYFFLFFVYMTAHIIWGSSFLSEIKAVAKGSFTVENSWFVIVLILMYIAFFIFYRKKRNNGSLIGVLLWSVAMIALGKYVLHWGLWWYNSSLCFSFGLFFASHEKEIIALIRKRYAWYTIVLIIMTLCVFVITKTKMAGNQTIVKIITDQLSCIGVCGLSVLICNKVQIGNRITYWLGSISYEIYLIHGLFLTLCFNQLELGHSISAGIVIICSLITAPILHVLFQKIYKIYLPILR